MASGKGARIIVIDSRSWEFGPVEDGVKHEGPPITLHGSTLFADGKGIIGSTQA